MTVHFVETCTLCVQPCKVDDPDTWKQTKAWVHGEKSDGATLREYTGKVAHDHCIRLLQSGQDPEQPTLPGLDFPEDGSDYTGPVEIDYIPGQNRPDVDNSID